MIKLNTQMLSKNITEHFLPDGALALLDKDNKLVAYLKNSNYGPQPKLGWDWVRSDYRK